MSSSFEHNRKKGISSLRLVKKVENKRDEINGKIGKKRKINA